MDQMDGQGGAIWLSREEWGVVIDALIEHQESALTHKAGNSESTSDERAAICADLIGRIGAAAAYSPPRFDRSRGYGIPSTIPVIR